MKSEALCGRQPVLEALRAGREINKILLQQGDQLGPLAEITHLARTQGIPVQSVERYRLDEAACGIRHQGVVALAAAWQYVDLVQMLEWASQRNEAPLLVLLDGLEDPQNLGTILRVVDASGAHGVIIPKRRGVGLTGGVARASAGTIEYVPVARVANLVHTIKELKEHGLWVVGADPQANQSCFTTELTGPLALVVGGEGKGIGRLVKEKCDFLVSLPQRGKVNSLNASAATAVFLYEILRQREKVE